MVLYVLFSGDELPHRLYRIFKDFISPEKDDKTNTIILQVLYNRLSWRGNTLNVQNYEHRRVFCLKQTLGDSETAEIHCDWGVSHENGAGVQSKHSVKTVHRIAVLFTKLNDEKTTNSTRGIGSETFNVVHRRRLAVISTALQRNTSAEVPSAKAGELSKFLGVSTMPICLTARLINFHVEPVD